MQPPDMEYHRCTCLNCSVALATNADECVCNKKKLDRVDEIMSAVAQAGQSLKSESELFYLFTYTN